MAGVISTVGWAPHFPTSFLLRSPRPAHPTRCRVPPRPARQPGGVTVSLLSAGPTGMTRRPFALACQPTCRVRNSTSGSRTASAESRNGQCPRPRRTCTSAAGKYRFCCSANSTGTNGSAAPDDARRQRLRSLRHPRHLPADVLRRPVQLEHRPLVPPVGVPPHPVVERVRQRLRVHPVERLPHPPLRGGEHRQLAQHRRLPQPGEPVPRVPLQHPAVDERDAPDPARVFRRPPQPPRPAEVVQHQVPHRPTLRWSSRRPR